MHTLWNCHDFTTGAPAPYDLALANTMGKWILQSFNNLETNGHRLIGSL
jgi:hypothetical protein